MTWAQIKPTLPHLRLEFWFALHCAFSCTLSASNLSGREGSWSPASVLLDMPEPRYPPQSIACWGLALQIVHDRPRPSPSKSTRSGGKPVSNQPSINDSTMVGRGDKMSGSDNLHLHAKPCYGFENPG
ncbi:hypothetical protein CSAL01_10244 [Colletotrichum salicis]|uniref:Uncharacterized protein n=1 Tax=Colletotrichum salicis TaxID=1209931 RepID=A0A135SQP4_9PEZI|nr:hypothetical protein CSAL01_10244 [Colletotrichum salicis]